MYLSLLQQAAGRSNDKISVIMPCYNRQGTISRAIESVLLQSMPAEMIELVIVDDGSTDGTLDILSDYEQRYPDNILLVRCDENSGGYIGRVRNIGLSYASGSFVTFLDSDDELKSDSLEQMYTKALLYSADVVIGGVDVDVDGISENGFSPRETLYDTNVKDIHETMIFQLGNLGYVWSTLYDADFLRKYNTAFPEDLKISEDSCFHLMTLLYARKCFVSSERYYKYHIKSGSAYNSEATLANMMDSWKVIEKVYPLYCNAPELMDSLAYVAFGTVLGMEHKCEQLGRPELFTTQFPKIKDSLLSMFPEIRYNEFIKKDKSDECRRLMEALNQ